VLQQRSGEAREADTARRAPEERPSTKGVRETKERELEEILRDRYGRLAQKARAGAVSCCSGEASAVTGGDPISSNLYSAGETEALPEAAVRASLGCGNPTALAELLPGEVVLDLGCGGGSTCSFRRDESVPPAGPTVST
jgi:hypothetical protein